MKLTVTIEMDGQIVTSSWEGVPPALQRELEAYAPSELAGLFLCVAPEMAKESVRQLVPTLSRWPLELHRRAYADLTGKDGGSSVAEDMAHG